MPVVYCITFPNGKRYVGIAKRFSQRKARHRYGYKNDVKLFVYNAMRKHGWNNLKWDILFTNSDYETVKQKEIEYIKEFLTQDRRFGYNRTAGGDGRLNPSTEDRLNHSQKMKAHWSRNIHPNTGKPSILKGVPRTDDVKKAISKGNRGRKRTLEQRKQTSEFMKTRPIKESTRKLVSENTKGARNPFFGKKHNDDTRKRMSQARKGTKMSEEAKKEYRRTKGRPVQCIETGVIYSSLIEAAEVFGCAYQSVRSVCIGRTKKAKGYTFRYVETLSCLPITSTVS